MHELDVFNCCDRRTLHTVVKKQDASLEEIGRLAAATASLEMLDAVNVRDLTALHLAVVVDRPDVVSLLVSLGAQLHRQERRYGDTVLHLACRLGRAFCLSAVFDAWMKRSSEHPIKLDLKHVLHSINYEGRATPKMRSIFAKCAPIITRDSKYSIAHIYATPIPSVRLSVTRVICVKTAERIIKIISPSIGLYHSSFSSPRVLAQIWGLHPQRGRQV